MFFEEFQKESNIFPYINRLHDILKDQDPFPLIRMPLVGRIGKALRKSRSRSVTTGAPSRRFREFGYRTRTSWSRTRRVVAKAEHLAQGPNPRFVVTSLGRNGSTSNCIAPAAT